MAQRRRTSVRQAASAKKAEESAKDEIDYDAMSTTSFGDFDIPFFEVSARMVPLLGCIAALLTMAVCTGLTVALDHDFGGTWYPYLSDCARGPPEGPIFAFGMSIAAMSMCFVAVVNYGKVKRDIAIRDRGDGGEGAIEESQIQLAAPRSPVGTRRNAFALGLGMVNPPFLALLAVFDTVRSPTTHLVCVLLFFPTVACYLYSTASIYEHLHRRELQKEGADAIRRDATKAWVSLKASVRFKRVVVGLFSLFTLLYLPVGMMMVSDWHVYSNDVQVHSFRAICQHGAVACIVLFYGSFFLDFGDLRVTLLAR